MEKLAARMSLPRFLMPLLVVMSCLLLYGCGGGGTGSGGSPTIDITDTWVGDHTDTNGMKVLFSFSPAQKDDTISGFVNWDDASPLTNVFTGTISGLDITLSFLRNDITITLTGKLSTNATEMFGTWTSADGTSGTWQATRFHIVAD